MKGKLILRSPCPKDRSRSMDKADSKSSWAEVSTMACRIVLQRLVMISKQLGYSRLVDGYLHPPSAGKSVSCKKGAGHKPPRLAVEDIL